MVRPSKVLMRDVGFWAVIVLVGILAWRFENQMNLQAYKQLIANGGIGGTVITQLDSLQAKELDAFLDLNQQVTTLETALMGGVFYVLFNSSRGSAWKHRSSALMGALLVSVSIYFG